MPHEDPSTLRLLRTLLEMTQRKVLRWEKVSGDEYVARIDGKEFSILFRYPLYPDDSASDRGLAYIYAPLAGIYQFAVGTDGMSMVWDVLAAGLPEWREHRLKIDEQVDRCDAWLRSIADRRAVARQRNASETKKGAGRHSRK